MVDGIDPDSEYFQELVTTHLEADEVKRALLVEGPSPMYHRLQLNALHRAWPSLFRALDQLVDGKLVQMLEEQWPDRKFK